MVRVHAYTCTPTAVGVRLPASRFLPISEVHMPTPEPLTPYPAKDRSNVAIIVGCVLWTGAVAWFAATVAGQLVLVALILATLALVLFGRYHPKAPSAVAQLSKVWLSHWKYSVTILALTVAGLSGGRLKATFDAMTPAQHLEAARADGKAMPSSARDHLAAIPSSAPEYQEAQKLLAELAPRYQAPASPAATRARRGGSGEERGRRASGLQCADGGATPGSRATSDGVRIRSKRADRRRFRKSRETLGSDTKWSR